MVLTLDLAGVATIKFNFPKYLMDSGIVVLDTNDSPIENPKWEHIKNERIIEFDNDFYIIKLISKDKNSNGEIIKEVQAKHMAIELSCSDKIAGVLDITPPTSVPATADIAMAQVLTASNSNWSVGVVDAGLLIKSRTFKFEWQTALFCLGEIAKKFNGVLTFTVTWDASTNKWVKVVNLKEIFPNKGYHFRYDKNINALRSSPDTNNIVTRLYCIGRDKLSINDQPTEQRIDYGVTYDTHTLGQSYIDNFQYFLSLGYSYQFCLDNFVKVDRFQDDVYISSADLFEDGKEELEKKSVPKLSYIVKVVDLSYQNEDKYATFDLGEIVKIYDKELDININAQILKKTINYEKPHLSEIQIENRVDGVDVLFKDMAVQNKNLYFDSAVKYGATFANSVSLTNDHGLTVIDSTGQLRVKVGQYEPGKYGQWMGDGTNTVFEFNTANNLLKLSGRLEAGDIVGGTISGCAINGTTINGGTITGTTITGSTINGTTINGGTIGGSIIAGGTISGSVINGGTITGATVEATGALLSGSIMLDGRGNVTPSIQLVPPDGIDFRFYIYPRDNDTLEFTKDDLLGLADIKCGHISCGLINGVNINNVIARFA